MWSNSWNMIIWSQNCRSNTFGCAPFPPLLYFILPQLSFTYGCCPYMSCSHSMSSCPFCHPSPTGTERPGAFSPTSFFFSPSSPPPSVFQCLCLIYPFLSDKVSGDQRHLLHPLWRCVLLLNYVQGQGLVCIQQHRECMANRWWETTCMPSDK